MTRTYTPADFANARFAEHESGSLAHRVDSYQWRVGPGELLRERDMPAIGWVPVLPARTIHDRDVEALCTDTASYERDDYLDGFMRGFQQAGGVILDDPEPTNTEKLESALAGVWGGFQTPGDLAKWLNDLGITAPNVKGN